MPSPSAETPLAAHMRAAFGDAQPVGDLGDRRRPVAQHPQHAVAGKAADGMKLLVRLDPEDGFWLLGCRHDPMVNEYGPSGKIY